jgi:hypothetical protein
LSAIYEQDFLDCSHGYRPGRSAKEAVIELAHELQYGGYHHVVEADIRGFFDHMDHDWVIKMLGERIDDRAFLGLIRKWLKAGILDTDGAVLHPDEGTPQGGIVSPVLANVYLHYALDLWFERVVKPHCRGKAMLCRYADDFVCAFASKEMPSGSSQCCRSGWRNSASRWRPRRRSWCASAARDRTPARASPSSASSCTGSAPSRGGCSSCAGPRASDCNAAIREHHGLDQEPPAPAGQGLHQGDSIDG